LSGTHLAKSVWDKGKHNILFAAEIAEMPWLPIGCVERKIRGDISDL
jgi:hypothetical protein